MKTYLLPVALLFLLGTLSCHKSAPSEPDADAAKDLPVSTPTYYFGPTFQIGTSWQFNYSMYDFDPAMCRWKQRTGTHRWTIASFSTLNEDTTFVVNLLRNESVHLWQSMCYPDQAAYDSTYNIIDTVQFTIVVSNNTTVFNWPAIFGHHTYVWAPNPIRMPRVFSESPPDSITVGFSYSPHWQEYAIYTKSIGPNFYTLDEGGNHTWGERLTLTSSP